MAGANKLIALTGATISMKESQLMMGGSDEMVDIPIPSFLIEHPKGLVLFDTGCAPQVAVDAEGYWGAATEVSQEYSLHQGSGGRSTGEAAWIQARGHKVCRRFASPP
jgi:hypothetical protein